MKGVSTVIATILMLVITIALAAMAYGVISGWFTSAVQGIELVDSYCSGTTVTMIIRNLGTSVISSLTCTQTAPSGDTCSLSPASFSIEPGNATSFTETCSGSGARSCIYRILPPTGKTIEVSAHCVG